MNKRVLYLGGYFQVEHSMRYSFLENGVEITFLIDDNDYAKETYWSNPSYHNFRIKDSIKIVSSFILEDFVRDYKPDVIIHRHYLYRPIMHLNSLEIARKLGIPFVHLEIELSPRMEENRNPVNLCTDCDIFLYVHDFESAPLKYLKDNHKACYFYPYGVSSFERSIPEIVKDREIGGFGYPRIEERERCENLDMFLEGIAKLGKKLHVYGDWKYSPWIDFKYLEVHPSYSWEESAQVMNRHKIAINFESIANVEGAYSHKMFQTIGCGVPTLTSYKESLSFLFGGSPNPVYVVAPPIEIIKILLQENINKFIGKKGEEFIHEKFDWFKRFDRIMKKGRIW